MLRFLLCIFVFISITCSENKDDNKLFQTNTDYSKTINRPVINESDDNIIKKKGVISQFLEWTKKEISEIKRYLGDFIACYNQNVWNTQIDMYKLKYRISHLYSLDGELLELIKIGKDECNEKLCNVKIELIQRIIELEYKQYEKINGLVEKVERMGERINNVEGLIKNFTQENITNSTNEPVFPDKKITSKD